MRVARTTWTALLLAGVLSVAATAQPPAPALMQPALNAAIAVGVGVAGRNVGVDFFYSNLAPYGYWVDRPSYGWVFVPRHIRHHWRPYSYGRWVYSDYGWTWASDEPYGWATYHYGRWYCDPDYGWGWVPGYDWGPAWVDWRYGGGYVGWAPLPPDVGWSAGVGLDYGGFDLNVGFAPTAFAFVPQSSFLAVNVGGFILPSERNVTIINNTTNVTNFSAAGGRVFNGGVPVQQVQQWTGQPVRQVQLANASRPGLARVSGNSVALFRPTVVQRANALDPPRVAPRAVATGRVAQQLVQERRPQAAEFRQGASQQAGGRVGAGIVSRQATQSTAAGLQQRQARGQMQGQAGARARNQAAPMGRNQPQALGRRQVTPPPQRTRGGTPPRQGARAQQVHQYVPPSQRGGRMAPSQRQQSQVMRRQATPPPQRTRGGTPPRQGARAQQVHQYTPPPQRAGRVPPPQAQRQSVSRPQRQPQGGFQRQFAPPPQARRESAPPPQRQMTRQAPPPERQPQMSRPAPAPQRQPQVMRQAPPQPQRQPQRQAAPPQRQPREQRQPPPPGAGA